MEESFWQARWSEGRIGFHEGAVNLFLERGFVQLGLSVGAHVFVPLCGKSFDLDWLLSQGMRVTGIEFNQGAVEEVFARLNLTPEIAEHGALRRYSAGALTLFCGDFYALAAADLGAVDAVYDRAAMVAVAPDTRAEYAAQILALSGGAPQLLIAFDYDQATMDGPPFSLPQAAITAAYGDDYAVELVDGAPVAGDLAKRVKAQEQLWHLTPKG